MRHYATACRRWQLRPLVRSMLRHCQPFALHVLAWDWDVPIPAEGAKNEDGSPAWMVTYSPRAGFLKRHPELVNLPGPPRSPTDTVSSVRWTFYADVLESIGEPLTCIDGDIWFWSDPTDAWRQLDDGGKLLVSPHRFVSAEAGLPGVTHETHRRYGLFNGGWVGFGDPQPARIMAALAREWCYGHVVTAPDGEPAYGDQGHLERVANGTHWKHAAGDVRVLGPDVPVNVAPWNVHGRELIEALFPVGPGILAPRLLVDMRPLIAYHYSSLRFDAAARKATQLADAPYAISAEQERLIYAPYVAELEGAVR